MEMKTFETLYKKSSTGADQMWQVEVVGRLLHDQEATIVTRFGQVGGKIQETQDIIKGGKNIGKANETTPLEQALLEAEALWTKKLKKGYVKSLDDARAGKVDDVIEGGVNPMLAHKFSEQAKKISFPALVQPKFDGHRCIAVVEEGQATLWTRTRKPITGLPHIIQAIEKLCAERGVAQDCRLVLDGELYNHDYRDRFEELTSFIRTPAPKPGHEVVQYHVYDVADEKLEQLHRSVELSRLFRSSNYGPLVHVDTREVKSKEELDEAFAEFMEAGYEGLMVRNMAGKYVGKRSYDLQKVKEFDDAEFPVIGVEEGRGKLAGKAIFVCRYTTDPKSADPLCQDPVFRCKMKGKLEDLAKYVKDPSLALGKMLTVRYFGISNTGGVPRFPVGIRFREDDVEQAEG